MSLFPPANGNIPRFTPDFVRLLLQIRDQPITSGLQKRIMKSTQPTISSINKDKITSNIIKKAKTIPSHQLTEIKGGGNPWIDAS